MATKKTAAKKKAPAARNTKPQAAKAKQPTKKPSQIKAALKILATAKEPMTCQEMIEAMAKRKLWTSPGGKTPRATLYASILRDIRKGKDARFKKAGPGKFTLKK